MVQRPASDQLGEKAVLLVQDVLNSANWVANRMQSDFGIDLHVKVFETEGLRRALPWEFHVQVKARATLHQGHERIEFPIDTAHLVDWYETVLPVLLVVHNAGDGVAYWVWIRDYLENLNDSRWKESDQCTIRIPLANRLAPDTLPSVLHHLKRSILVKAADSVLARLETPGEDEFGHPPSRLENPYYQPLEPPDDSIRDLALARCLLCQNYFWIDESDADGCDVADADGDPLNPFFTKAYEPFRHEPAVYVCDAPEEFCPFCFSGRGALKRCTACSEYKVPSENEGAFDCWNDPIVSREEAQGLCADCLNDLRGKRV